MRNNPNNSLPKSASDPKAQSDEGITIGTDYLPRSLEEEKAKLLADARFGGKLYSQGIATEFVENPLLKNAEKTVNNSTSVDPKTSFTRGANVIEIDRHLYTRSSEEDMSSMQALTNDKIDLINRFRRKRIAYGNHNAMHEVMSQKLFSLTGMFSPDTKIMIHESEIRDNGTLEASIISPMITGYKDLGDFLI
ncbi:MAG: hypothetical protein KGQ36_06430, partial [Rickettsiales bacterium]|nr:hypothetical protein [Rickettsiales bacterium]